VEPESQTPPPSSVLPKTLPFNITPNFLQDLGFNLYTKLDRVIVEFLANAHDADATKVTVALPLEDIQTARKVEKLNFAAEVAALDLKSNTLLEPTPLEMRTISEDIVIRIEDNGCGMGYEDLEQKFLRVSRKRREEENTFYTPGKRLLMGRKGLGKLAGFGIAHKIVVTSKRETDNTAYRIVLDYDVFKEKDKTQDIEVPLFAVDPGALFPDGKGTIVELSKLVHSGFQRETTIQKSVGRHFRMVKDFDILLDKLTVFEPQPDWDYAFPPDEKTSKNDLLEASIKIEDGRSFKIRYRIWFRPAKGQRPSHERGVRVYCHNRMASPPDLFDIKTSSNGYVYTSYMEGIVEADYLDEQKVDFVATDRQGLKWENVLLEPLHEFIASKIVAALDAYAKFKEARDEQKVENDSFTNDTLNAENFIGKRLTQAKKIAKVLAKNDSDGVAGSFYQTTLPIVVKALGHGEILTTITQLARDPSPKMAEVVRELAELTRYEFEGFVTYAKGRIKGIEVLRKIKEQQDFKKPENEKELQNLLEKNPWIIDPTFYYFLSADASEQTLFHNLAKNLEIGTHVPKGYDKTSDDEMLEYRKNKRPDLVFLLGNKALQKLVIIELKSANTPLLVSHLSQLKRYINDAEIWIKNTMGGTLHLKVSGLLIGTRGPEHSTKEGVRDLRIEEAGRPDNAQWQVFDLAQILDRTYDAHKQLLEVPSSAGTLDDDSGAQ
jgi:hypothetical protein